MLTYLCKLNASFLLSSFSKHQDDSEAAPYIRLLALQEEEAWNDRPLAKGIIDSSMLHLHSTFRTISA